jgi:transcriptional regulator with XRE-family HTH domain
MRTYVRVKQSQREQFGRIVAAERKKAGFSQEELGFRAGVHRTEVSLIERGRREPRLETILKLSRGLGVMPATLIDDID